MTIETYTVTAPAAWASALINGDYSGLESDSECERVKAFEASLLPGYIVDMDFDSVGFRPPYGTDTPGELARDYCDYTVMHSED